MFSKFRALDVKSLIPLIDSKNNRKICEIFDKKMLYASNFEKLNDICEGGYYFINEYSKRNRQNA